MVQFTVRVDDKLALRLKLKAVEESRHMSEIIRDSLLLYLTQYGDASLESLEAQLQ